MSSKNALCSSDPLPKAVITSFSEVAWTISRSLTPPTSSAVSLLAIATILGPDGESVRETL